MMKAYDRIVEKLLGFSRKYYTKLLIKGIILFLALGILFFLVVTSVEYFLWLNNIGRLLLLVLFVFVEGFLMYKFIITPISFLLKFRKGLSNKDASLIIGQHFPEVDDRLYNLLELAEDEHKSELLLASIEQRSVRLNPVPFKNAIDFRENLKYVRYLTIPLLIIILIWISGNTNSFFGSTDRVLNYNMAYEPPAPFSFRLMAPHLRVMETEEVLLKVATEGEVQPNEVYIVINDRAFLMQWSGGMFQHRLSPPLKSAEFYFEANEVRSRTYQLEALQVPAIQDFKLNLVYPAYTGKKADVLNSTGNAIFPEGTEVEWQIEGKNTKEIKLVYLDTSQALKKQENMFSQKKRIFRDLNYQLTTSNDNVDGFEKLTYNFKVVSDKHPALRVQEVIDTLNPNMRYYQGEASDDYKLISLSLVYYPSGREKDKKSMILERPAKNFSQFYYTFPSGMELSQGMSYEYYFEVVDNDGIRGGKSTKSRVFKTHLLDNNDLNNKQLELQRSLLDDLDESLDNLKEQEKELEEINRDQKEKSNLSFNDQNRIREFLQKQKRQENMMQRFSRQLKENLEQSEQDEQLNQLLKERLERQEIEARKNEKLLEQLRQMADKIDKEELSRRLDELAKNQKNSERNLEQLLELTKRYYVTERASQLAMKLEKMSSEQDSLSGIAVDSAGVESQEDLNKEFQKLAKDLDELKKDNEALNKPLPLKVDEALKESIEQDQTDALKEMDESEKESQSGNKEKSDEIRDKAGKKQKSAAQKMQEMSKDLEESSSQAGGASTITEDAEMLRQILDNLITFSFKQEALFEELNGKDLDLSYFSSVVGEQKSLQDLFGHVDDSLFALSLRRAELSEFVNEQINEVYYNMDKAVESIVEGRIYQGVSYQQYVLTAANNMADFLANILDNMQQSMKAGSGSSGQGNNFQLPDIIRSQEQLGDKMGQMKGKSGSSKQGQEQQGEGKEGEGGEQGQQGNEQTGQGQNKNGEREGEEGRDGKGQQEGEGEGYGGQSEEELREIYDIYKEQQGLRELLETQLQDLIREQDRQLAEKLIKQMEDVENEILRNGITERTIQKSNNIQHQLLKLENATLQQGKKEQRISRESRNSFTNPITTKPEALRDFKNDIEILNRQALPLQQIFQKKVKDYFDAKY